MTIYDCPECGDGKLKKESSLWRCNGLADPGHNAQPLIACEYWTERPSVRRRFDIPTSSPAAGVR
jgi:hypothetical protein